MAETALVESDIEAGRDFVELLDRIAVPVVGAFWLYRPDAKRWRLVIVSNEARQGSKDLYLRVIDAGAKIDLTNVEFQPPETALFKALGGMVRVDGLAEVRMQQSTFNGVYVEDALIYRLAA